MIVCHCSEACDRLIRERIAGGARTIDDLAASAGVGVGCGGCHPVLERLLAQAHGRSAHPVAV
jgi:bacterioferritin-associated ferredoxin